MSKLTSENWQELSPTTYPWRRVHWQGRGSGECSYYYLHQAWYRFGRCRQEFGDSPQRCRPAHTAGGGCGSQDEKQEGTAKLPVTQRKSAPGQHQPLFLKYTRAYLSQVTGYSRGYLSRLDTGGIPVSRSFVERVCYKLEQPQEELFLPAEVLSNEESHRNNPVA